MIESTGITVSVHFKNNFSPNGSTCTCTYYLFVSSYFILVYAIYNNNNSNESIMFVVCN